MSKAPTNPFLLELPESRVPGKDGLWCPVDRPILHDSATICCWSPSSAALIGLGQRPPATPRDLLDALCAPARPGGPATSTCFCTDYGGHQFGTWAGPLGDGRVVTVARIGTWDVQVVGAGRTPYSQPSRDGRCSLRGCVREFLGSECMAALGCPTTRSLAVVDAAEELQRGRPRITPRHRAGVLVRLVPGSSLRFGSVELVSSRGDSSLVALVCSYALRNCHGVPYNSELLRSPGAAAAALFDRTVERAADLVSTWQSLGFVHGMLNTDNLALMGFGLDYGTFAFLDSFCPDLSPSDLDENDHRYAFGRQPSAILWGLTKLSAALGLSGDDTRLRLARFETLFHAAVAEKMRRKLGFRSWRNDLDRDLLDCLLFRLSKDRVDWTCFWRALCKISLVTPGSLNGSRDGSGMGAISGVLAERLNGEGLSEWEKWFGRYRKRLELEWPSTIESDMQRRQNMEAVNPKFVARTNLIDEAAQAIVERRDHAPCSLLHSVLSKPFEEQPSTSTHFSARPVLADDATVAPLMVDSP